MASQALLGALLGAIRPGQTSASPISEVSVNTHVLSLCTGEHAGEWGLDRSDEDGTFALQLADITVACPWLSKDPLSLGNLSVAWNPLSGSVDCALIGEPTLVHDTCEYVKSALEPIYRDQSLLFDQDRLHKLNGKLEHPDDITNKTDDSGSHGGQSGSGNSNEEWEQIVIFVVIFLGMGALLEVFLIIFMQTSLTKCLRNKLMGESTLSMNGRRSSIGSATSSLEEQLLPDQSTALIEPVYEALAKTHRIPRHAQFLMPLLIIVCVAMFASANRVVGASVEIVIEYEHKPVWPPWRHHDNWEEHIYGPYRVFNFSLVNTVTEMHKAGVYILALLVLVWSGIWPYLKLVLLLFCWVAPTRLLSVNTRGRMLVVFDALGKWCMIDIFLMVMMSVAFRFHVESSEIPHFSWLFPRKFAILDVTVSSHWGLFGFMFAAILSIILGHVMLGYHRTAVAAQVSELLLQRLYVIREDEEEEDEDEEDADGTAVPLQSCPTSSNELVTARSVLSAESKRHKRRYCCTCPQGSYFNVGSDELPAVGRAEAIVNKKIAIADTMGTASKFAVAALLIATFALVLAGALADSFQFTFTGTAARAIKVVQPASSVRTYSLVSIAQAVDPGNDLIEPPSRAGILFVQTVYLLFALIMPLVQCVFLLALWLIPMRLRDQKIIMMVTELVSAFSAMDCFIVSIMAACVEIDKFALFLVGDRCDKLEQYTKEPCFGIETAFLPGCWVTVVAAAALFTVNQIVVRLCDQILRNRELEPLQDYLL